MKTNAVKIRKAKPKDFAAVFSLIQELAAFEKAPHKVSNSVEQMQKEKKFFQCYVAEVKYQSSAGKKKQKEIVGMAIYFFAYYTWVGKSLYLDDLYVKEAYRQQKIGRLLLQKVFQTARKKHCKRMRWQVLDWNQNAINFYRKIGTNLDTEWINCDIEKENFIKIQL